MDVLSILWLFLIISSLQPLIQRRLLEAARQRLLSRLQAKRGSRVIVLAHRQETMSLLGFPLMRYIDINDSEEVLRAIDDTDPDTPIDLILHTPGGLVLAALQIARAVAAHPAPVRVLVPHYAMSGGTLIALAADEIIMSRHAVLGPVDPQLGQYPAASILAAVERKPASELDDETLILADVATKAIDQVRDAVTELLVAGGYGDRADELAKLLTEGRWTHDYPITVEHARQLGLRVSTDMPPEVMQLMRLYPQPVRQQRTVEYVPQAPRRPVAPAPGGRTPGQHP